MAGTETTKPCDANLMGVEPGHEQEERSGHEQEERSGAGRTRKAAPTKEVIPLIAKITPDTSPQWFKSAHSYLKEGIDDEAWKRCVDNWMLFENDIGMSEISAHQLPVKNRPLILSKWMSNRKYSKIPDIEDAKAFANEWLEWWNSIQPEWRKRSAGTGTLPLKHDVDATQDLLCIRKGGPSGLVTVLTGLKWWARASETRNLWLTAVDDVNTCFEIMKTATLSGQKRKENEEGAATRVGRGKKRKTG